MSDKNFAPPNLFDMGLWQKRLERASRHPDFHDFLRSCVTEDMAERLLHLAPQAASIVEIGCFSRSQFPNNLEHLRKERMERSEEPTKMQHSPFVFLGLSPSLGCARQYDGLSATVNIEQLALHAQSFDAAISGLYLHWMNDIVGHFIQIRRALKPDGVFLGALFTHGSLQELREAFLEAEMTIKGGAAPRIAPLARADDLPSLMQRAGFISCVVDVETLIVRYDHPLALMKDLRAMAQTLILRQDLRYPLSRLVLQEACNIYQQRFSDPDGRIRAHFEITYLTGMAPRGKN